jgi:hypothetical protein
MLLAPVSAKGSGKKKSTSDVRFRRGFSCAKPVTPLLSPLSAKYIFTFTDFSDSLFYFMNSLNVIECCSNPEIAVDSREGLAKKMGRVSARGKLTNL